MIRDIKYPRSIRYRSDFELTVDGVSVDLLRTDTADFAIILVGDEKDEIEVVIRRPGRAITECSISPKRMAIAAKIDGEKATFKMSRFGKVEVKIDRSDSIYLWASPPDPCPPQRDDPNALFFAAGQIHEVGVLEISESTTVYLEAGAVVKGRLHARDCRGLRVCGHGIWDGSYFSAERGEMAPLLFFERCQDLKITNITMIHPSRWMLVPGACRGVRIENLKQIGEVPCSDGIDIVGSSDVVVQDCFLRNHDDCIAIKALDLGPRHVTDVAADLRVPPENIVVERCTLINGQPGNAMEIGHELAVDYVRNVTFRDIDVLQVDANGAVFSIHNNDRAIVEDVCFEDIRIEHCYDKLIDFRISRSMYSSDEQRGRIRQVTLKNIDWHQQPMNPGYTVSLIGGWDPDHRVEGVSVENFLVNGRRIRDAEELEVFSRHAEPLVVR